MNQAIEYFKAQNMESKITEYSSSSATVELAAAAVGCTPAEIAKTLSFIVDDSPILIVAAGDAKIDNPKFKSTFQTKAKMLTPEQIESLIGHKIGGVCPFGIKPGVKVYLDQSLRRFTTVYAACGSSNTVIELSLPELEQHSSYLSWIDVCKGWNDPSIQ